MNQDTCGCCEGIISATPEATANRPGLSALAYRIGTHATFLQTMQARLSSMAIELPNDETVAAVSGNSPLTPLRSLKTRRSDDPSLAFLDAWATVADVLTFYQERLANEGYLETAMERRSILELARLVGYVLKPGISASVYLAYTLEPKSTDPVVIPAKTKAQSVPGPRETAQTFETGEPFEARAAWNNLQPRLTRPQTKATILNTPPNPTESDKRVYLKGISTNLKAGDPLLIDFGDGTAPSFVRVLDVQPDPPHDWTRVTFQDWHRAQAVLTDKSVLTEAVDAQLNRLVSEGSSRIIQRTIGHLETFRTQSETLADKAQLGSLFREMTLPALKAELETAQANRQFKRIAEVLAPVVQELETKSRAVAASPSAVSAPAAAMGAIPATETLNPASSAALFSNAISVLPRSSIQLNRNLSSVFEKGSDLAFQAVNAFQPGLQSAFVQTVSQKLQTVANPIKVYALRVKASLFAHNAPFQITRTNPTVETREWALDELTDRIYLDASYDKILPNSWVVMDTSAINRDLLGGIGIAGDLIMARAGNPNAQLARADYGISAKSTYLELVDAQGRPLEWFKRDNQNLVIGRDAVRIANNFQLVRRTAVYTQSEELALAEEPMPPDVCKGATAWIELDGWYGDLKSGRWAIVSGERTSEPDPDDSTKTNPLPNVSGSELVMLTAVLQAISATDGTPIQPPSGTGVSDSNGAAQALPNEKLHTFIKFAQDLDYCYKRETLKIYGNVVKATHGETRKEVLGSGDTRQPFQSFTLHQAPLTYVAAPNPSGVDSTLQLFVNEVRWHETDVLALLTPTDRRYLTRINDRAETTIVFGDGEHGARLPTGRENVRAEYRTGIGKVGNVNADQITTLMSRPNGVKAVTNPLRASGGADKESRDQARLNVPLALMSLDRLVSTQDYADLARTFAGIGKAVAARLADGQRELVHITIAGTDDIPIDSTSDLYQNLMLTLRRYGDPFQPFRVELRELRLLVISANVALFPDYVWDVVIAQVRTELLAAFSFERRALGQDVLLSEVIAAIQKVPGVSYVDVDFLAAVSERTASGNTRRVRKPEEIIDEMSKLLAQRDSEKTKPDREKINPLKRIPVKMAGRDGTSLRPAELAILSPLVPDTLILNQIV